MTRKLNVDKLLKKKKLTGEEVGRLYITAYIHDIKTHRVQGSDKKPLFTNEQFHEMINGLETEKDFFGYKFFYDMYKCLFNTFHQGQGFYQQFYNGYYRTLHPLMSALKADRAEKLAVSDTPIIVTEKQYQRIYQKAKEKEQKSTVTAYMLITDMLEFASNDMETAAAELPEELYKAIKATEQEKADNERILRNYNKDTGEGYYTLKGSSEPLDPDNAAEIVKAEFFKHYREAHKEDDRAEADILWELQQERYQELLEIFFRGKDYLNELARSKDIPPFTGTDKELEDAVNRSRVLSAESYLSRPLSGADSCIEAVLKDTDIYQYAEWHDSEELPELSKFEVLQDVMDRYRGLYEDDTLTLQEQAEELRADYPAAYKEAVKYLKAKLPRLKKMKQEDYTKGLNEGEEQYTFTCKELDEAGIFGYTGYTEPSEMEIAEAYREDKGLPITPLRGVAVMKEGDVLTGHFTDENGDYKPASQDYFNIFSNLKNLYTAEVEGKGELTAVRDGLFIPAIKWLCNYNALLHILEKVYGLEGLDLAEQSTQTFEKQLRSYNSMVHLFYLEVYGDPETVEEKRAQIKYLFPPIIIENLKPTQEAIAAVQKELAELGVSEAAQKYVKENYDFYELLQKLDNKESAVYGQ